MNYICTKCGEKLEKSQKYNAGCLSSFVFISCLVLPFVALPYFYMLFLLFINLPDNINYLSFKVCYTLFCIIYYAVFLSSSFLIFPLIASNNKNICPECKNSNCVIPVNSPKGIELLNKYHLDD